jgi:hypothetical protein
MDIQNSAEPSSGFQTIAYDEILMQTVLAKIGPIIASVSSDLLVNYTDGIINSPTCSLKLDHSVLIVGYDRQGQYYIVKNSWGTQWGEQGYFRIAMGSNMCGIAMQALYLCPDSICPYNSPNPGQSIIANYLLPGKYIS